MRIILGLDPGLRQTGWGVISMRTHQIHYQAAGDINPPAQKDMAHRLGYLQGGIEEIMLQYQPAMVVIEEIYVNHNGQSTLKLGMARGALLSMAGRLAIPVVEYAPRQVKKMITGQGQAQKKQIGFMVKRLLPTIPNDLSHDALDALALAIVGGWHGEHLASI